MIRSVMFGNNGQKIIGVLSPKTRSWDKVQGVVMFHGFTGSKIEAHSFLLNWLEVYPTLVSSSYALTSDAQEIVMVNLKT